MRRQQGITLLELMIALMISTWLLTQGMASWQEMHDRHQALTYMQGLQQLLQSARVKAISQQKIIRVCPSKQQQCAADWHHAIPAAFVLDPFVGRADHWRSFQAPAQQHRLHYNRLRLEFRADGGLNALQNGTFVYCARDYPWYFTLTLSQAGRSQHSEHQGPCPI